MTGRHATPPGFPFASSVALVAELERAACGGDGPFSGEDLVRLRALLEPCRDVDSVAADE